MIQEAHASKRSVGGSSSQIQQTLCVAAEDFNFIGVVERQGVYKVKRIFLRRPRAVRPEKNSVRAENFNERHKLRGVQKFQIVGFPPEITARNNFAG